MFWRRRSPATMEATMSSDEDVKARDENPLGLTLTQMKAMLDLAHQSVDTLWELATSQDLAWTPESTTFPIDNVAISSRDGKPARTYKCEIECDIAPEELFDILHGQFETSGFLYVPAAENTIVQTLSGNTDVVHVTAAECLGGTISSRDFINTRTWRKKNGGYIIGSTCAGKKLTKPAKGVTRGENGITGFVILPDESSASKSRFIWIRNCDIKGYIPSHMIHMQSLSEMCCFARNLRRHLVERRS